MEKQKRSSQSYTSPNVSLKTCGVLDEKTPSRRLSIQGMFQPATGSPYNRELYSSRLKTSEIENERDRKTRVLTAAYLKSGSCSFSSAPRIYYFREGDSSILFPFPVLEEYTNNHDLNGHSDKIKSESRTFGAASIYAEDSSPKTKETDVLMLAKNPADKECLEEGDELETNGEEENQQLALFEKDNEERNTSRKTARYRERRKRNNASAKKSRDARRARELETQVKVVFLEKENMRLLTELMAVQHENLCLRSIIGVKLYRN